MEAWRRGGSVETWSQIIHSGDGLPPAFKIAAGWLSSDGSSFPYVVYSPRLAGTRRGTAERLAALTHAAIYIWEWSGRQVEMTAYPIKTISAIEVGEILLYSWLMITGLTSKGNPGATTIEFNTVSLDYYRPFINRVRPAPTDASEAAIHIEQGKFNYLDSISYKFMNFSRASLLPGETVIDHLWQPRIRRPILTIFGRSFYRTASVAHIAILTDQEVILILEDEFSADLKGGRYGSVRRYAPLERVAGVTISPRGKDLVALSLTLSPDGRQMETLYQADRVDDVERFRAAVESRIIQQPPEGV